MSDGLKKEVFSEDDWDEVQSFDCGDMPYEKEVSDWLKGPFGADTALTSLVHPERPAKVWLYRLAEGTLVGFGALGKSTWRWKGKKDPKIPLTIVIWFAVAKEFRRQPEGAEPSERYSGQIFRDLIAEAMEHKETHPILGLHVHKDNEGAIRLYRRAGFTENLEPTHDPNYLRMATVLDRDVLARLLVAAKK